MEKGKTYLRSDESIRGYFIISFLSLYMYCSIFVLIMATVLAGKFLVKDAPLMYSRVIYE